jgi:hypothetical protein
MIHKSLHTEAAKSPGGSLLDDPSIGDSNPARYEPFRGKQGDGSQTEWSPAPS